LVKIVGIAKRRRIFFLVFKINNQPSTLMKKHIAKITTLSLLAAAVIAAPALSRAVDVSTNAPGSSGQTVTPRPGIHSVIPFHGKVTAVDTNAMTLTVGNRTLQITSDTKISKDGKSAKLSDGVVGERVQGAYRKSEGGKPNAVTVHFGARDEGKLKKGSANG
jgi:hypothetical protein